MRSKTSLAIGAVAIALLSIVWYCRQTLKAGKAGNSRVELLDHVPPQDSTSGGVTPGHNGAPPSAVDQEPPGGDEVGKLIAAVNWVEFGGAVLAFTQKQEQARRDKKRAHYDTQTIETLAQNNLQLQKIADLLGVEDFRETRFHERVWPSFARGWMKAVGITLTPGQDAEFGEAARAFAHSRAEEAKALQESNRLDKLAWDAERGLQWDETVRKVLTPDQFADYARPAGLDPFWGRQASRQEFPLGDVQDSADRVEAFWLSSMGLSESLRPLVRGAATEFVQEIERQLIGFRARYPGEAPRDEEIRLRISLLRVQAGAEKSLGDRIGLKPEQRLGVDQGSGTVLDWQWK